MVTTTLPSQSSPATASVVRQSSVQKINELKVMTMNMWNVQYYMDDRVDYICDLVSDLKPDLLALQEVPPDMVDDIVSHLHSDDYDVYDSCMSNRPHGEIIASQFKLSAPEFIPFKQTDMRRGMTVADVELPTGHLITFVTAQMESAIDEYDPPRNTNEEYDDRRHFSKLRRRQIKDMFSLFNGASRVIFAGDMNRYHDEYIKVSSGWHDTWEQSGSDRHKYEFTYDSKTNPNAKPGMQERLDMVLYKHPRNTDQWVVQNYGLAGCKSFMQSHNGTKVMPSDHFAVIACFGMALPALGFDTSGPLNHGSSRTRSHHGGGGPAPYNVPPRQPRRPHHSHHGHHKRRHGRRSHSPYRKRSSHRDSFDDSASYSSEESGGEEEDDMYRSRSRSPRRRSRQDRSRSRSRSRSYSRSRSRTPPPRIPGNKLIRRRGDADRARIEARERRLALLKNKPLPSLQRQRSRSRKHHSKRRHHRRSRR